MGADVGQEVVEDLTDAAGVTDDLDRLARFDLDRPRSVDRARCLRGLTRDADELDGIERERAALIEPGQQQQVLDQEVHAGRFGADAVHGAGEVLWTLRCTAVEQLGVGRHRGERGAQLV